MRILHIDTGREMHGGQHQVLLLLHGLRDAGHEQVLLARSDGVLRREAEHAGFAVHSATLASVWRHSTTADLVHAHDARGHTLAALAARCKFVVSRRVAFQVKRGVASRWKYAKPARFLAVSRFVANELERAGVRKDKIDVVFDGVMPAERIGVWNSSFPAVALASADPQKGRDLMERAGQLAGVPVRFSADLVHDFLRASMFVYITRSEGLGSAALLAMQMGVPVVASRVGGLPEVIEDGRSGLLVDNDPAEIANAMQALRDNQALTAALIENAHARVCGTFSAARLVELTLASYGRVLAG